MTRWAITLATISLVFSSCNNGTQDSSSSLLESPVLSRPIVALVPVIERARTDLKWSVSQELSHAIRQRLTQKNHLYLMSEDAVISMAKRAMTAHDPFGLDTAWVKKAFPQNEFVAFMELLEHKEMSLYPTVDIQDSPAELNLTVRIRVFDTRGQTPQVVLQEIVQQSHHIPRPFTKVNFNQVPWGDEAFEISPLGIAHEALTKEVASRIEDYILLTGR
jgi:hypothetical protein